MKTNHLPAAEYNMEGWYNESGLYQAQIDRGCSKKLFFITFNYFAFLPLPAIGHQKVASQ